VASRRAGEGRYAILEREQRWVLDAVPAEAVDERLITDDYLIGTRLRLRKIQSDSETIFKLCQKVRVNDGDPELVKITNMYLSLDEYERVLSLPSAPIVKTRRNLTRAGSVFAIDQFHGRHAGLVLAETELKEFDPNLDIPAFARSEVTNDDRFSGGNLAFASDEVLRQVIGFNIKET
jgi:CYTH domain-containing protein